MNRTEQREPELQVINASDYLQAEPEEPDQVFEDTFDKGDKFTIIGSSKMRKSFFLLQMLVSLASGRAFLNLNVPKARRVLLVQLEIQEHHYHRRVRNICRAMGITANDLGDRLLIVNARGVDLGTPAGMERIIELAKDKQSEVVAIDPFYKMHAGIENAAEDVKATLHGFDKLAEITGASPIYVHHDAKGSPGDKDIVDRGAGSNVMGRDYDGCITLTAHSREPDAAVVDIIIRNYRPQEPFTIGWTEDENGGYRFEVREDIAPEKKTSRTKKHLPALSTYVPIATSILGYQEMEIAQFKEQFKKLSGISNNRNGEFINWATSGGNPQLETREERGKGMHKKWIWVKR